MSYALLFPGQGSQHADMLPWLESQTAAQPALDAMAHEAGYYDHSDIPDHLRAGGLQAEEVQV